LFLYQGAFLFYKGNLMEYKGAVLFLNPPCIPPFFKGGAIQKLIDILIKHLNDLAL